MLCDNCIRLQSILEEKNRNDSLEKLLEENKKLRKLLSQTQLEANSVVSECHLVIPGTVIMCGEMAQYCSQECMRKANEKDSM